MHDLVKRIILPLNRNPKKQKAKDPPYAWFSMFTLTILCHVIFSFGNFSNDYAAYD